MNKDKDLSKFVRVKMREVRLQIHKNNTHQIATGFSFSISAYHQGLMEAYCEVLSELRKA